jgi:hypothetical protein
MPQIDLPHPFQVNIPKDQLDRDYLNVLIDRSPDPAWHFKLNLHRATRIAPDGKVAPTVAEPFQTLALFQRPEPLADLEIFGLHLPVEINTADWLDLWLAKHNMVAVSSKPLSTTRGLLGDCVCIWETPQGPFAGRFAALRWGGRIFLLTLRTPRNNYSAIADDFFVAAASFAPEQVDGRLLNGEVHQQVVIAAPVAATITLPASYKIEMDIADSRVSAYGGDQQAVADLPDDPAFGKINFLLAEASLADHPAKAAAIYLNPLMKNPITLGGDEFIEEAAPAPFDQSWMMVTPATFNPPDAPPIACELRCRVMTHPKAWFVAGVLGPARHAAPIAWMRNKRALELITNSVELGERLKTDR